MRRKMATANPPMDESAPPAPAENETMDEGGHEDQGNGAGDKPTAFLPKELGGGKQWKAGDEIVLRIDAVDPETGEMQVSYASEEGGDAEPADSMEAMDSAIPEEKGGY